MIFGILSGQAQVLGNRQQPTIGGDERGCRQPKKGKLVPQIKRTRQMKGIVGP